MLRSPDKLEEYSEIILLVGWNTSVFKGSLRFSSQLNTPVKSHAFVMLRQNRQTWTETHINLLCGTFMFRFGRDGTDRCSYSVAGNRAASVLIINTLVVCVWLLELTLVYLMRPEAHDVTATQ